MVNSLFKYQARPDAKVQKADTKVQERKNPLPPLRA